ncbi:MAG: hypothetical protein ACRCXZ_09940 [Patescibacteria group bacterium]
MSRFFDDFSIEKAVSEANKIEITQRTLLELEKDGMSIPYKLDVLPEFERARN